MDAETITTQLAAEYPGKKIIRLPAEDPAEIIVEIGGTTEEGLAVAIIDRSTPHVRREMTEVYEVERGILRVHVDGETQTLESGQSLTIRPGHVHWAKGRETRLLVRSRPPWIMSDHIICVEAMREQMRWHLGDDGSGGRGSVCAPNS